MTAAVFNRRGRIVAMAFLVLAVAFAAWFAYGLVRGRGGPPADEAQRLVPADALVFVDLSTDAGRRAVRDAAERIDDLDAYERLTDELLERLSGSEEEVDAEDDVRPWLGDQAALALTDSRTGTAGSLVVVEVTDAKQARRFLARNQRPAARSTYKGVRVERFGTVSTAIADDHLLIGQDATVRAAIDRSQGRGRSLADDPTYKRAIATLPENRAATAYATKDGLDRLLIPAGGTLGTLSTVLDRPRLRGVALSLAAEEEGARVVAHSILERGDEKPAFRPTLHEDLPGDAVATLLQDGVTDTLRRAFDAALAGTGAGAGTQPIIDRLRRDLDKRSDGRLERDLVSVLRGEVALVVTRGATGLAPGVTLVAKARDEAATRQTLGRLRAPIQNALRPREGEGPRWQRADANGADAWTLRLPNGAGITYAVFGGKLAVSTTEDGISQIRVPKRTLADAALFDDVLGDRPSRVRSLGFIDFRQLLELGEQTGLNDSRSYLAARDDLRRIGAVGISSTESGGEATAEILLSIP